MNFKNTLRKEINLKIRNINNQELLSKNITKRVIATKEWEKSNDIFLYISFKNEVSTFDLISKGIDSKKKVYAPLINGKTMDFHRIDNIPFSSLVKSNYGILEPPKGLKKEFPNRGSLMIIPGVSFTKEGHRLGRGGGYYDKYLALHNECIKMGVAFNLQISKRLELDPWDQILDIVITENSTYIKGVKYGNN